MEDLELLLVGLGDVGKVLLVIGVDLLGVGSPGAVSEVVLVVFSSHLGMLDV